MTDDELIENELVRCNHCGYCLSTCPTYHVELEEGQAARGRLMLLQALRDGELALPDRGETQSPLAQSLKQAVSGCLLCGACTEACFSGVRTDELMVRARAALAEARQQPRPLRFLTDRFLLHPDRLTAFLRLAGVGRRGGVVRLLRRLSPTLDRAEEEAFEPAPERFLRDRLAELGFQQANTPPPTPSPNLVEGERSLLRRGGVWLLPRDPHALQVGPRVLYFIGCGTNYQLPEPGAAAMLLLSRAGCEVVVAPHVCCGLPPYSYGDLPSARALARRNVEALGAVAADYIVTECGSCSRFLKRYPDLLAEEEGLAEQAQTLGAKLRDFTELLVDLPLPAPVAPLAEAVTYHDPCHLGRGQGLTGPPRRLLREAAGAHLVELLEADWCCGGAGTYNLAQAERSARILQRKLGHIAETGASVVATACPACILQIRHGLRQSGSPVAVRHVAEIVAEAQGIAVAPRGEKSGE